MATTTSPVQQLVRETPLLPNPGAVQQLVRETPVLPNPGSTMQLLRGTPIPADGLFRLFDPIGDAGPASITNGTAVTATDTANLGERMLYDPSGGTFTLNAPASPVIGSRWAVKNRSTSIVAITIGGNGSSIEDPTSSFSLAASFSLSGDGISTEWEYDGTQWQLI